MNNLGKNKQLILAKHPNGLTELDLALAKKMDIQKN